MVKVNIQVIEVDIQVKVNIQMIRVSPLLEVNIQVIEVDISLERIIITSLIRQEWMDLSVSLVTPSLETIRCQGK